MLWKFYKNSDDACYYIFGTIHLATEKAFTYSNLAEKYIGKVSNYVSEMDLDVGDRAHELVECFLLPEDQTLSTCFSERNYKKYRKLVLKSFHVDLMDYERFSPFYVLNMISIIGIMEEEVPSDRQVLDHHLFHYAQSRGKQLDGIETIDDQMRIARSIDFNYQVKSFKKAMKNITAFKKSAKKLLELYARGDYKTLYKMSKKALGKIRSLMLYDRNQFFIERIEEIVQEQPSFIAVGAAHLPGDIGVLAMLKKRGYKVKKVVE